ncbi:MAG TPA: hypothetical protein DCM67_08555 [Propionibacteriaceae bacterium]|nr:hypothetical protein [Propionibacteriaceae bacterium]
MSGFKELKEIPLSQLRIGRGQVRLRDVGKEIDELADSIRKVGLLEPIVVAETEEPGVYEIVTGQRRFLAHQELKRDTILAAVLSEQVDELTAKVLSVTENLVRRDLNNRDLIDVCTELFHRYGSIKDVAQETGLPYAKVRQYVKYDQLIPELQQLVKENKVSLQTALRAQQAAAANGEVSPTDAVEFAREMSPMSGAQQKKIVTAREENPDISPTEVIEDAKSGGKVTQVLVTLTSDVHRGLRSMAEAEGTNVDDAARMCIESALSEKGFMGANE